MYQSATVPVIDIGVNNTYQRIRWEVLYDLSSDGEFDALASSGA